MGAASSLGPLCPLGSGGTTSWAASCTGRGLDCTVCLRTHGFMGETPDGRTPFTMGGYHRVQKAARILTGHTACGIRATAARKGPHPMASNFQEKFNSFMNHRNGPDQLSRDSLILGIVLLIVAVLLRDAARTVFTVLGLAAMVYSYWRMFSSKVSDRSRENGAYVAKRTEVLNKLPFGKKGGASNASGSASRAGAPRHRAAPPRPRHSSRPPRRPPPRPRPRRPTRTTSTFSAPSAASRCACPRVPARSASRAPSAARSSRRRRKGPIGQLTPIVSTFQEVHAWGGVLSQGRTPLFSGGPSTPSNSNSSSLVCTPSLR